MSDKHPIDDFFRQQLEDHSYDPPMHLWDQIAKQRNVSQPTPTPFPWWGWTLGVLGLIALTLTFLWLGSPTNESVPGSNGRGVERLLKPATAALPSTLPPPPATTTTTQTAAALPLPLATKRPECIPSPTIPARVEVLSTAADHDLPPRGPQTFANRSTNELTPILSRTPGLALNKQEPGIPCTKFEEKRIWRSTVDFMVSPDLVRREIEAGSPQYRSYAEARNTTEEFRYGVSASVRYSTVAPSGLALRSGLNWSQINERFIYQNDQEERITITTEYGPTGQVIGTDTIIDYYSTRRVANNRYTAIDIPLIIGYEFQTKSPLDFSLNGGTFVNLLFTQEGEFLSPATFEPVPFSSDHPAYRNRLGLAFFGSIGITYRISPRIDLLVEPHIKWRPQSVTVPDYVIDQRFFTSGIFIGFRKKV